ncbi:hypothetical protein AJ88_32395 [Mesorhizobium amorphae CCBAU 01583]|nr:hypothetical protein AJ88_32395 [Mesorhizobium amorphae CCBAU 01583]
MRHAVVEAFNVARGIHHRRDDFSVAGAAAEHASQRILCFHLGRIRPPIQKRGCRDQQAGRADAALRRAMIEERGLQRRQFSVGQAFDRDIAAPAADAAGIRQAQTGSPSTSTVQAPQSPASQPTLVPVSRKSSRSTEERRRTGGTKTLTAAPLTSKSMLARPIPG